MWLEERKVSLPQTKQHDDQLLDDSLDSSESSGEELPVWVRGEQRWVSGIVEDTTCKHVVEVLLQDEKNRGRHLGNSEQYHVTERWRGVEQPLDENAKILEIWTAWGPAHSEIKLTLRRIKSDRNNTKDICEKKGDNRGGGGGSSRRLRHKHHAETGSVRSDRSAFRTVHPKRITALQNEKQPSSTEELLKLVLAQGEVIRKQLKKLRHSENQIGFLEEKTHRARVRKHGSNYLLETYLKGLADAVDPVTTETCIATDKNSDSGVVTEGDSDQQKQNQSAESSFERFSSSPSPSPSSANDFAKDLKDDDTSSTVSEATVRAQLDLFDKLAKLNKRLLKQEETLVRLHANLMRHTAEDEKIAKAAEEAKKTEENPTSDITKALTALRTEMAKGSCELQHNDVVLGETNEAIGSGRSRLDVLYRDLGNEDQEFDMLQTLLYTVSSSTPVAPKQLNCNRSVQMQRQQPQTASKLHPQQQARRQQHYAKEMLDTLV